MSTKAAKLSYDKTQKATRIARQEAREAKQAIREGMTKKKGKS